jgi:hypothetical protein
VNAPKKTAAEEPATPATPTPQAPQAPPATHDDPQNAAQPEDTTHPEDDGWSEDDDWTDETLRLLRTLRAPHRRSQARSIAFAAYCTALVLIVWGAGPSFGLFLRRSLGADYTAHGPQLVAAIPSGAAALGLATLLLAALDGLWRGPLVVPRPTADWLLAHPVRAGRLLKPWFRLSCALVLFPGLVAAGGAMVALGLMVDVGLGAAFFSALAGALCLPLLAVCVGLAVECSPRVAVAVRRAAPLVGLVVVLLAVESGLAAAGHRIPGLERAELWSGPWGWAGITVLGPTPGAVAGRWAALGALVAVTAGALLLAERAVVRVPIALLRQRARTAAGVVAALGTGELRAAAQSVAAASGSGGAARVVRLPAPRHAALAVPWRDAIALLRVPWRLGRAVFLAVPAVLCGGLAADAHGGAGVAALVVALAFAHVAVGQLLEPARTETDDTRRASWSPYGYASLMLRHAVTPGIAALLLGGAGGVVVYLLGGGAAAWLVPAAVPPLLAAGLVSACRGRMRQELLLSPVQATGSTAGPLLFLGWYAAGPLVAIALLVPSFWSGLHTGRPGDVAGAAVGSLLAAAGLGMWARARAAALTRHATKARATP